MCKLMYKLVKYVYVGRMYATEHVRYWAYVSTVESKLYVTYN
jgi:hypothetical protein